MDHITKQIETLQPTAIDKVKLRESKKEGDSYQCKYYVLYVYTHMHIHFTLTHKHNTCVMSLMCQLCCYSVAIVILMQAKFQAHLQSQKKT